MKKIVSTFLLTGLLALVSLTPNGAMAATVPTPGSAAELGGMKPCPAGTFRVRRNTSKGKKIRNSLIAGGVGAAIGAGLGGGRGALIGLGSGAGGYLVYRYVRDRRGRCVPRYIRG